MPHTLVGQVNALVCLLVCLAAFVRGGGPERIMAAALLAALLAAGLDQDRTAWLDPQRRLLAIDAVLLLVLCGLVFTSRRKWVVPATAAQFLSCASHFLLLYLPAVHARAYLTSIIVWSYVVLLSLAWGVAQVSAQRHAHEAGRRIQAPG